MAKSVVLPNLGRRATGTESKDGERVMDKRQSFIEMRAELSAAYEIELKNVQLLLRDGATRIENDVVAIQLSEPRPLAADGEAGQIFSDEFTDMLNCTLERYERNLKKEIERLGLSAPDEQNITSTVTEYSAAIRNRSAGAS